MYNSFLFVGTQIWNYIIDHLDIKVSLPKFKQLFKTHIHSNYFTFYYISFILFVSIISLINIINSSLLQQIVSFFPDKYVTLSLIFFFNCCNNSYEQIYVRLIWILYHIISIYIFFSYRFIIPTLTIPHRHSFRHSCNSPISLQYVTYALDIFFISLLVDK